MISMISANFGTTGSTVDFNFADPILTSMTLECVFAPAENTVYTMRYNYEKANEDGYDQETSTYDGTTGEDAYIYYQNRAGFDLKEVPTTKKIEADGSTIIDIYYDRLRVQVDYQTSLSNVNLDPVYVKYGTAMKNLIPDLTRPGYSCRYNNSSYVGWFDAEGNKVETITEDVKVTPKWEPKEFKINLENFPPLK